MAYLLNIFTGSYIAGDFCIEFDQPLSQEGISYFSSLENKKINKEMSFKKFIGREIK